MHREWHDVCGRWKLRRSAISGAGSVHVKVSDVGTLARGSALVWYQEGNRCCSLRSERRHRASWTGDYQWPPRSANDTTSLMVVQL